MSIKNRIEKALADGNRKNSADLQHLRDFYEQKKQEGVVTRQEYSLPVMDTIGRSLYIAHKKEDQEK